MDAQVRNFRDFLLLYNKLTEMCFKHCTDNLNSRQLSSEESTCIDRCVIKFSGVNQRVMGGYVEEQTVINARRMKEMETQMQTARDAELKAATEAANIAIAATTTETLAVETATSSASA